MSRYPSSASDDDQQPMMWLNGHAIYAAYFIVVVFVASLLFTAMLMAFKMSGFWFTWLPFDSARVLKGEVWRILTYGLVNPPVDIWFAVDMFMIAWFGRELEKFFGRRKFLMLFGGIYLLSPLLFCLIGLWWPMELSGETGAFALFIAFAVLYPNVAFFLNILAKWLAAIFVGFYTVRDLAHHDWVSLISLWATVSFAFVFVRYEQGRLTLPSFRFTSRNHGLRVLPDEGEPAKAKSAKDEAMAEVDALLDKIAQSGMASLTARERARLDRARATLRKKDSSGP